MPIFDSWLLADAPDDAASLPITHPALRSILIRRGIRDEETYRKFIAPAASDLHDPSTIHGMDYACERIGRAVRDRQAIVIYGDYDVDGKSDQAVYRNGKWLINRSTAGPLIANWGINVDLAIPGVYEP